MPSHPLYKRSPGNIYVSQMSLWKRVSSFRPRRIKFVKLNGLATGKSAITIDESLPIVSLSNVAQDKACFGVVSKMEESNAAYRTEITGGLVSESVKIAGDNRAVVNSVGEGAIWVVDTNGDPWSRATT